MRDPLVRNALREAAHRGLVPIEERAISGWRNDTNVVRLVSEEWRSWLRLARGRQVPAPMLRWPVDQGARRPATSPAGASRPGSLARPPSNASPC
ncbi:hypothetical protein M446_4731 [Methylobacterium sp. 4-46]|nr:hypothetical protein M446_4731 [Methylobacterium sp. 4-46]